MGRLASSPGPIHQPKKNDNLNSLRPWFKMGDRRSKWWTNPYVKHLVQLMG